MDLARRFLGSLTRGVEIGGSAFNPFPGVRSWNLDSPNNGMFQRAQQAIAGRAAPIDVYGSAEHMPFCDGVLDFVLASHVIEHMPDTIAALGEWDRVLRPGGICFLIVPHRDRTQDRQRPCTELLHHLGDHALGTTMATDSMVPASHYHVWRTADFVALVEFLIRKRFLDWQIEVVEDRDSKVGNGFTVVAQKRAVAASLPRSSRTEVAFHMLTPELPFQVLGRTLEVVVPGPELPPDLALPAGRYRMAAIHAGFPARAGAVRSIDLGAPHPVPRLVEARWAGTVLCFRGEGLTPWTWVEARFQNGTEHRVLPVFREGELLFDFAGVPLPDAMLAMAVTPPPGGGRSNVLLTPRHAQFDTGAGPVGAEAVG